MSFTLNKLIKECELKLNANQLKDNQKVFYADWLLKNLKQISKEIDADKIEYDAHHLKRKSKNSF